MGVVNVVKSTVSGEGDPYRVTSHGCRVTLPHPHNSGGVNVAVNIT